MKPVVIDASAAASWLIETQSTTASDLFLADRADYVFMAPGIFEWEVLNLMVSKARRGSLSLQAGLAALRTLRISVEPPKTSEDVVDLGAVALETGLSLFDADYLALALQTDAAIASRDRDLLDAARSHGVAVHDLRDRPLS